MSPAKPNYYEILGVDPTASHDEIQRAYRKLARKFHPDINKASDAEEQFKKVNEAYHVVGDAESRKKYDAMRAAPEEEFTAQPQWDFRHGEPAGDFSDFFYTYFGGEGGGEFTRETRGGGVWRQRGRDQEVEMEVSLSDSLHGARRVIDLERVEADENGRPVRKRESLEANIPKGVTEGTRIRLAGKGGKGSGGAASGDLYLLVHLKPDPRFQVEDHDILTGIAVSPWEAALGAKVEVPTVEGAVKMTLPPGTSSGHILRLKGKGLPRLEGAPGDQLVSVQIVMPKTLSEKERRLFEELAQESRFNPRA